jgi:hypothetical protein
MKDDYKRIDSIRQIYEVHAHSRYLDDMADRIMAGLHYHKCSWQRRPVLVS